MGRRPGPGLNRERVVEVALELVCAEGPDALGVSRVARELGIQPPSIYNHVGKGEALARAVALEGSRRLLAAHQEAVRGVVDPAEQLRVLALVTRQWVLDHGGLYALMARTEPDNDHPEFAPILRDTLDLFERPLVRLGVDPADTIHAIRALRAAVHGFLLLETSGQFALRESPEESYRYLVASLIRGVAA